MVGRRRERSFARNTGLISILQHNAHALYISFSAHAMHGCMVACISMARQVKLPFRAADGRRALDVITLPPSNEDRTWGGRRRVAMMKDMSKLKFFVFLFFGSPSRQKKKKEKKKEEVFLPAGGDLASLQLLFFSISLSSFGMDAPSA